jgi:hypothetical protein
MADNILANIKSVSDIFVYINISEDWCTNFWNYLSESNITWGAPATITLIERDTIKKMICDYILEEEDKDNDIYIMMLERFFENYNEDYLIIN